MNLCRNTVSQCVSKKQIKPPFILFLGAEQDLASVKTATGVAHWRSEICLGQLRLSGCNVDLGLPDITVSDLASSGGQTLLIGVAPDGGVVKDDWVPVMLQALCSGLDIASGLHAKLSEIPSVARCAHEHGRQLHDVRVPSPVYKVGSGVPRTGRRLLTVGTDCAVGKMFTALAIEKEMRSRNMSADFRATGQTGIFIAGTGVPLDAVVSDFISGAVEWLSPPAASNHWDLIEGQGSLFHPAYAGVTLGLVHGSQADALVLCHDATLKHMDGLPNYPVPEIEVCLEAYLKAAELTNARARFVGVSVNTSKLEDEAADDYLKEMELRLGLPCCDPMRNGVAVIVDGLES